MAETEEASREAGFDLDSMLEVLDGIEIEIEAFKKKAQSLAEEQCSLESTLGIIISDFEGQSTVDSEEIVVKAQRLSERLGGAAKIYIQVPRDSDQKDALSKVNELLAGLGGIARGDLQRLINSTSGMDPSDQKFEKIFHACSIDDQKFIKAKLDRRFHELNDPPHTHEVPPHPIDSVPSSK